MGEHNIKIFKASFARSISEALKWVQLYMFTKWALNNHHIGEWALTQGYTVTALHAVSECCL